MSEEYYAGLKIATYTLKKDNVIEVKPVDTLLNRDVHMLREQRILEISFRKGTYGQGGPGFVGLLLESLDGKKEWMVFTIWAADWSILFDGHWVGAHPMFYDQQKPLYSNYSSKTKNLVWDLISENIINGKIISAQLSDKTLTVDIETNGQRHKLEVLDEDPRLPPMPKGHKRRTLKDNDKLGDYIVFHEPGGVIDTVGNKA